jgi:hypothetical protein
MSHLRHVPLLFLSLASFILARQANAETLSITNKPSIVRLTPSGETVPPRPVNGQAINLADCLANQRIRIAYSTSGLNANQTLEVWAGQQDCKPVEARSGNTQQCWRAFSNLPLQQAGTVEIPVRNFVKKRLGADVVDATGDPSVCADIPLSTVSLYFMLFQGNGTLPLATDQVDVSVKTVRPAEVAGLTLAPGNTRILATFEASGDGGLTDQQGFQVFCDENPTAKDAVTKHVITCADAGDAGAPDATPDGEAGADGASGGLPTPPDAGCVEKDVVLSPATQCYSSVLTPSGASDGGA